MVRPRRQRAFVATGRCKRWTCNFTDRVFAGFGAPTSGVGVIIYHDQLIFVISPKDKGRD